jgi:hypothetical protein
MSGSGPTPGANRFCKMLTRLPTPRAKGHRSPVRLLQAARREGENRSPENLPDDGIIMRVRTDANTGGKFHEFHGKRSFIADMSRPGRKVERIVDRRTGQAIWGKGF